jgi:hypothetical protein
MKWFMFVCLVVGGIGIAIASCGPKNDFCPTRNPDMNDLACHPNFDAMTGTGGTMGLMCDGPQVLCPNGGPIRCSLSECP